MKLNARTLILSLAISCILPAGAALAALRGDLSGVTVYPNPFEPGLGHTVVVFDNLTAEARLRVYTLSGETVYDAAVTTTDGKASWNVTNGEGTPLATGVYIYLITAGGGQKKTGKLGVLK